MQKTIITEGRAKLPSGSRGFSLVEMIVAVGLFAIVMVICVATLFALVNANRKAQALQSVMNNLNVSLDGMARAVRMGSTFNCGASAPFTGTRDCANGSTEFTFEHYGGDTSNFNDQWQYKFVCPVSLAGDGTCPTGGYIARSEDGGTTFNAVTAPEISINSMNFYVTGSTRDDTSQPLVIMVVKGTAASNSSRTSTSFHIQVAATQRLIDL